MSKQRKAVFATAAAGWLAVGAAGMVRASVSYNYVAVPEGTVTAGSDTYDLYLQETLTGSSTSLIAGDGGLAGAGVAIVQTSGSGATIASATNNTTSANNGSNATNFSAGSGGYGNVVQVNAGGTDAHVVDSSGSGKGVYALSSTTTGGTTTENYLLGTLTLNVAAGANATFRVESLYDAGHDGLYNGGAHGETITYNTYYDMDPSSVSPAYTGADANPMPFTVNVASVPEPASLAVFGAGAAGLLLPRRRSRYKSV